MASQKRAPKTSLEQYYHKKLYWHDLTKAKNQFKKPQDMSGVDFENF